MPYKDPEKRKEYQRKWQKKWYANLSEEKREKERSRCRKYGEENKEKISARQKKYCRENREQRSLTKRKTRLKKDFNLSLADFDLMFQKQKGLCVICGLPEIGVSGIYGTKREISIDHNHNTKQTRGLLCSKCNQALGLLNVDNFGILNLQKAVEYLSC